MTWMKHSLLSQRGGRRDFRFVLALALCVGLASPLSAQALLKLGSARPDEVLTYEEETLSSTTVRDNNSTTIDGSRLGLTTRRRSVNLYFLYAYDDLNLLSYEGNTALASALSDNLTVSASGSDLPATLQERGWFVYLPLGIGSTRLQLRGGSALASDTKDVSSADFHTFMSLLFTLNRKSSNRLSIGVFRSPLVALAGIGEGIKLLSFKPIKSVEQHSAALRTVPATLAHQLPPLRKHHPWGGFRKQYGASLHPLRQEPQGIAQDLSGSDRAPPRARCLHGLFLILSYMKSCTKRALERR